jgi:LPS-assembly lipoprotein
MKRRGTTLRAASPMAPGLMATCLMAAGLVAAYLISGCGFRLQGSVPLPHTLAVVRIDTNDTQSDFYVGLRKALIAAGTRIDDEGKDESAAVIHIIADSSVERILTVSTLNVPTENELTYTLKFSVSSGGHELIASEEHHLIRDYSYSESAQLAKERERAILSEALANDLVSVVMRRLASLSGASSGAVQ